jgi:hypothetical protein
MHDTASATGIDIQGSTTINDDAFHHLVLRKNAQNVSLFTDATDEQTDSVSFNWYADQGISIAARQTNNGGYTDYLACGVAHVEFLSVSASDAWIKADYNAQTDNLITWGVEEEAVFITAAPIKSTTQITAEVVSRIEIVAAPIKSNTQITARVRMFWPHKINGLASGNIASFYRQAVNIEDVDKINDV